MSNVVKAMPAASQYSPMSTAIELSMTSRNVW
jgi:hypothetical protein